MVDVVVVANCRAIASLMLGEQHSTSAESRSATPKGQGVRDGPAVMSAGPDEPLVSLNRPALLP
jgi:hypothetical protein